MNNIIHEFVDAGYPKYGICVFGMLLIYQITMSCIDNQE